MTTDAKELFHFAIDDMDEVALAQRLYHWTANLSRLELDPVWGTSAISEFRMAYEMFGILIGKLQLFGYANPNIVHADDDMIGFAMGAFRWLWQILPGLEGSLAPARQMFIADHVGRH